MRSFLIAAMTLTLGIASAPAQSLDDLNIQIHGYATQGFLYTTNNNILTTNSSNGSAAWTEAVVNITAQPDPKLRVSVQGRYFLLGNLGNQITLDYASADYTVNEKFGVRFGKVKTPSGLFNETQDIDPSYMWSLLPQSTYPITSRNSALSQYGGVVYGTLNLGKSMGKLEYRGWGGETAMAPDDGYFLNQKEAGINFTNGLSGVSNGGAIHWKTPLPGLMIGASDRCQTQWEAAITDTIAGYGTFSGSETFNKFNSQSFFAHYEKNKLMVAGEWSRLPVTGDVALPIAPTQTFHADHRAWYGMASYKLTDKLSAGIYDSQMIDHQAALGAARYSKDWALSGRYDFNQFLYAKVEQHFIDGTALDYDTAMNPPTATLPTGLLTNSKLTILKIGVSF